MSILGDAWPHEASRRVKAAIAARFGKGWSVRHDPRLVRLAVSGPKGREGYRTIPAEHNGALSAALGLSYACPLDGPSVGPLEWEHFVWALENGRLHDAHVQTRAAWSRIEQARRYRAANPWLVFVWQTYVHGSARNDLPGEWEKHSRYESEAAAQAAAQRLQALDIATRIELANGTAE